MRIASVASAFPRNYYTQEQIASALKRHWANQIENPKVLDRLLSRVAVDGRHLALPIEAYDDLTTWGQSNDAWITVAEDLAEQSICRALTRAGLSERDLDAIFFVSVTGIASPSIDARLMNRMNLRTDIKRNPIFGLGCVAGAAGIARAADYVRAFPDHNAVLVSVELVFSDLAAAQPVGRQPHLLRIIWGRIGGGDRQRQGRRGARPGGRRDHVVVLSRNRRRDGLGHFGRRLPHRALGGSSKHGAETPGP